MVYDSTLEGKYIDLKSCTTDDAEFTLAIRKDPEFSQYLPSIDNTIEQQISWINLQRDKQGDYFFVVWDKQGNRIGTISIYGIEGDKAESGRLAIKADNPFQALEAQMIIFRFAFDILNLKCVVGYIYADNTKALRFNKQFGGKHFPVETDSDGKEIVRFEIWSDDFKIVDQKLSSVIYRKRKGE